MLGALHLIGAASRSVAADLPTLGIVELDVEMDFAAARVVRSQLRPRTWALF